ncbi:MAG: hypothetical protein Q9167_005835 [Letrouitia subvulpina]
MSTCVAELDGILQSMLGMKPPGVSPSKINSITHLCNVNIQSESVLIQKVYTHFKKAPGTHKLGVLYVVDSVTRSWLDKARTAGLQPGPDAADGTYAAGVYHVTELLPILMTDIINSAPEDQKDKIRKLVDIWERGSTFSNTLLSSFKQKLDNAIKSTTPPGSPPKDFIPLNEQSAKVAGGATAGAPTADTSAILKALADMAKTTGPSGMPSQASSSNVTNPQNAFPQNISSSVNPVPSIPQAVGAPGANAASMFAGLSNIPNFPQNMSNGQQTSNMQTPSSMMPQSNNSGAPPVTQESLQQQLQILQLLQAQNVPQDQWANVLSVIMSSGALGAPGAAPSSNYASQPGWQQNNGMGRYDQSRDLNGHSEQQQYMRSPSGRYRDPRSRSRSPPAWDRRHNASPPHRRDSPVYGEYNRDSRNGDRGNHGRSGRGRGGNEYRQRSPDRYRRSPSPRRQAQNPGSDPSLPPPGPKYMEHDNTLGRGMIKVLSRTLFVGGVTSSEETLRSIFSSYGVVQTCIVNVDKRHAFVKMLTRGEAQVARDGMERYRSPEMQLRTRWGVGFGPRDCSDYQTGISIIPIDRLTDADRKWMLTAEYGGTGGKSIESGMVVEEPDIEIGAGVSSKAISRRMATDKGGHKGPHSSRDAANSQPNRFRQPDNRPSDSRDNSTNMNIGVPPAIPNFGFQFPSMPNGMSMFPPGMLPQGPGNGQNGPPGA